MGDEAFFIHDTVRTVLVATRIAVRTRGATRPVYGAIAERRQAILSDIRSVRRAYPLWYLNGMEAFCLNGTVQGLPPSAKLVRSYLPDEHARSIYWLATASMP